jgi:hypothetical protein
VTQQQQRQLLIELMEQQHGIHYTLGWLKSSYVFARDPTIEAAVLTKTLAELQKHSQCAEVDT